MNFGIYKNIDWTKYESYNLNLKLPKSFGDDWETCGSAALSLITQKSPRLIEKHLSKTQKHWSSKAMVNFLRKLHYTVIEITKYGITNFKARSFAEICDEITYDHLLLCNQLVCKNEASWFLIHKNKLWHNFDCIDLPLLHFVNKPIQNIYCVWHKKWS